MPTSGDRTAFSDAELGAQILAGWERMSRAVPDGPRFNRRLAEHFRFDLREVEHVRDTRNRVAHPGEAIRRADLDRAVAIIRRAQRRGSAPARKRAGPGNATPRANRRQAVGPKAQRSPSRTGRPRRGNPPKGAPGEMWGPAADLRKVRLFIAVLVVVVVVVVALSY